VARDCAGTQSRGIKKAVSQLLSHLVVAFASRDSDRKSPSPPEHIATPHQSRWHHRLQLSIRMGQHHPYTSPSSTVRRAQTLTAQSRSGTGRPFHSFIVLPCAFIAFMAFCSRSSLDCSSVTNTKLYPISLLPALTPCFCACSDETVPRSMMRDSLTPKTASEVSYGSPRRYSALFSGSAGTSNRTLEEPHLPYQMVVTQLFKASQSFGISFRQYSCSASPSRT